MFPVNFEQRVAAHGRVSAGFTIIELGVVLAVMSIIASVALPDFIEMARNQLAKNAAAQVMLIEDQARAFFHQSVLGVAGVPQPPSMAMWPGETGANACTPAMDSIQALIDNNYLSDSAKFNPWGVAIQAELVPSGAAGPPLDVVICSFRVSTDVPVTVAQVVETYLPGGICNDLACGGSAAIPGYARCCMRAAKPGLETAIAAAMFLAAGGTYP